MVVFDLDGVLIDSEEANVEAFSQGLQSIGLKRPAASEVSSLIGLSASEMLARLGCPEERVADVFQDVVKPYYLENLHRLARPMAGAMEVLQELRSRSHRLVACTSGDRNTQEKALRQIDLWQFLEAMQTPDDSQFRKPQVEYLKELLQRVGYKGRVIHVEDSQVGLQMGLDFGATTVFANYGYGSPGPWQPHYRIDQLSQLLGVVE
jgi:phosphoglycolate phosphatase